MGSPGTFAVPVLSATVQALSLLDFSPSQEFCQWFLRQCGDDPFFSSHVPFIDEAGFTKNGILMSATDTFGVT
jgi:hypothetical protein